MKDDQTRDDGAGPRPGYGAGLFFLAWAAAGWTGLILNDPVWSSLGAPGLDPGPAILPLLVCLALTIGGLGLLVSGVRRSDVGLDAGFVATLATPALFLASMLAAAFATGVIGFRVSGFLFALLWLFALGGRDRPPWQRAVVAAVLALLIMTFIEFVFVQALRVPLP